MEDIDLLAENIIKIEEFKEEPVDEKEDYCWNSIAEDEPTALQHSVKEDKDEELEPSLAVFVQPLEKQEGAFIETKDPLAANSGGASVATIKPFFASSSPGEWK
ncbi:hypothetical protein R5R35_010847 [Gryllus longicercus]|uniref:Uncharacterized protein n=1 Tax=Gryllus longicercus TaxID=2509291 RepID=A0AAN9Z7Q8_9ORTH